MNSLGVAENAGFTTPRQAAGTTPAHHAAKIAAQILVAAFVFFNLAEFRVRELSTEIDSQIILRLAICAACGLFGLYNLPRTLPWFDRFPGALCLCMGIWAVLILPASATFGRSLILVGILWCTIVLAAAALKHLTAKEFVFTVLAAQFALMLACWATYLVAPDFGDYSFVAADGAKHYRVGGLVHPNGLAHEAALSLVLLVAAGLQGWLRRPFLFALCAFAVATLLSTGGRASIVAAAVTTLVVLWRHGVLRLPTAPAAWILAAVVVAALGMTEWSEAAFVRILARSGDLEELTSANGRLEIWSYAARRIADSPVTGYGYGCGDAVMYREFGITGPHAHNQLMSAMLDSGIPGGLLLLAMAGALLWSMVARPDALPDGVVVLTITTGFTEVVIFNTFPSASTLLWIAALLWREVQHQPHGSSAPAAQLQESRA